MDTLTREQRSERMRQVRSKDTKPEMQVRRLVFSCGYRYRLHRGDLPGTPDLVFPARRKVIFVHGCFWHRHAGCRNTRWPKSRLDFWRPKLEANKRRDVRHTRQLTRQGWGYLIIWECEVMDDDLKQRIVEFLQG